MKTMAPNSPSSTTAVTTDTMTLEAFLTQLQSQLEFYFSPRNLSRDLYLQTLLQSPQHVGLVPTDTICGFPKIRELYAMYNERVGGGGRTNMESQQLPPTVLIRQALEHSTVIRLSDDGKFIMPVPSTDDSRKMLQPATEQPQLPAVVEDEKEATTIPTLEEPLAEETKAGPTTPLSPVSLPSSPSSPTTASCASSVGVPTHPLDSEQREQPEPSDTIAGVTATTTTTNIVKERTTLIVRDIPDGTTAQEVLEAFTSELITPTNSRPEIGNTWYVTFETEAQALVALTTSHDKTIQGQRIRACFKSELSTSPLSSPARSAARERLPRRENSLNTTKPTLSTNDNSMVVILSPQEQMSGHTRQQQEQQQQHLHAAPPLPMMPYPYAQGWTHVPPHLYPYYQQQPVLVAAPAGYNHMPPAPMGVQYHMIPPTAYIGYQQTPVYPVEYNPELYYHQQQQYLQQHQQYHHHPPQPYHPHQHHHQQQQQHAPPPNVFVRNLSASRYPTTLDGFEALSGGKKKKKKNKKAVKPPTQSCETPPPPPPSSHDGNCPSPSSTITHDPTLTPSTSTTTTTPPSSTASTTTTDISPPFETKPEQPLPRRLSNPHESTREYSETTTASVTSTVSTAASTATHTTAATFATVTTTASATATATPATVKPVALFTDEAFPELTPLPRPIKINSADTWVPARPAYAEALKKRPIQKTIPSPAPAPQPATAVSSTESSPSHGMILTVEEILRQLGVYPSEPKELQERELEVSM